MFSTKVSKIIVGWVSVITFGVGGFILTKSVVDAQRRDAMKIRDRMRNANTGEYESKRSFTG